MRVKLDTVAILRQENGGEDVCESECRIRKGSLGYSYMSNGHDQQDDNTRIDRMDEPRIVNALLGPQLAVRIA